MNEKNLINNIVKKYPWLITNWATYETLYFMTSIIAKMYNCIHTVASELFFLPGQDCSRHFLDILGFTVIDEYNGYTYNEFQKLTEEKYTTQLIDTYVPIMLKMLENCPEERPTSSLKARKDKEPVRYDKIEIISVEDKKESDDWIKSAGSYLPNTENYTWFIKFINETTINFIINKKMYVNIVEFIGFSIENSSSCHRFFLTDRIKSIFYASNSRSSSKLSNYVSGEYYRIILGFIHKCIGSLADIKYWTSIEGLRCHILFSVRNRILSTEDKKIIEHELDDNSYFIFSNSDIGVNVWGSVYKNALKFCLESIKSMDGKVDNLDDPTITKLIENKIKELKQTNNNTNQDVVVFDVEDMGIEEKTWLEKCTLLPDDHINHGNYAIKFTRNTVIIYKLIFIGISIYRNKYSKRFLANDVSSWGEDFDKISHHRRFGEILQKFVKITDNTMHSIKRFCTQCSIILGNVGLGMHYANFGQECSGIFMFGIESCTEITKRELVSVDINKLKKSNICEKYAYIANILYNSTSSPNFDENKSTNFAGITVFHEIKNHTTSKNVISEKEAIKIFKQIEKIISQRNQQNQPPITQNNNDNITANPRLGVPSYPRLGVPSYPRSSNASEKTNDVAEEKLVLGRCIGAKCSLKIIRENELHTFIRCASNCKMIIHFACWRLIAKSFDQICLTPQCGDNIVVLESREGKIVHNLLKPQKKNIPRKPMNAKKDKKIKKPTISNNKNSSSQNNNDETEVLTTKAEEVPKYKSNKIVDPPKELVHPDKLIVFQSKKQLSTNTTATPSKLSTSKKISKNKPLNLSEFRMMVPDSKDCVWNNQSPKDRTDTKKSSQVVSTLVSASEPNNSLSTQSSEPSNTLLNKPTLEAVITEPRKELITCITRTITTDTKHTIPPKPIIQPIIQPENRQTQIEGAANLEKIPSLTDGIQIEGSPPPVSQTKNVVHIDNKTKPKLSTKADIFLPQALKSGKTKPLISGNNLHQQTQQTQQIQQNNTNQWQLYQHIPQQPIYQPVYQNTTAPMMQYPTQNYPQLVYYQQPFITTQPQINFQMQFQYNSPFSQPQYQQQF